ncbi:MAG: TonB-dependent receptor [Gammaproteobacteria bacterium]|nr:TonB-dependent receptor [Gammaproteobacteria bacterium]
MELRASYRLTPVAGAIATALTPAHQVFAQDDDGALEEIVVTATKRSLSIQDIPASIQAITSESLAEMGAKGMEDYSRFIPSVNVVTYGAGSNTVVFRGAITGSGYIAQSTSSVYLDEISITTTGSQPAIRMVDVERVEALSGPQGTLYGSDAQAGTMRIITNKPVMNEFGAVFDGEVRGGSESDESFRGSLTFNVPLIDDKLALRIVGYSDRDGGYIDNVLGHTPDSSVLGVAYPAGFGTLDNSASVEENWNEADTTGGRLILKWDMNEEWSTTLTALTQKTESGADNDYDPYVGDLQTVRFHDEYRDDKYDMYSLVVDGDLGFAQLVASVNYYDRDIKALYDITAYAHYWAALYCHDSYYLAADLGPYYWANPDTGYAVWYPVYCGGPSVDSDFFSSYYSPAQQDKSTAEIRLSSQGDTLDWIVGMYYEESNDSWQAPFATPTNGGDGQTNIYQNSASASFWEFYFSNYYGTPVSYPEATSHWYSESSTDWEQTALFGEMTWHINDEFDLTVGGRYYDRSNNNKYIVDHPGDSGLNGEPDTGDPLSRQYRLANGGRPEDHAASETDFIPKVALSWTLDDDRMMYGLFTRGARPGGVNRSRGQPFFSTGYDSDLMDNYEVGYRSSFGNGHGRLNVTAYHMLWTDYQLEVVDPSSDACPGGGEIAGVCGQPWQQIVTNAGEAHITGANVEVDYAFNERWTIGANAEFTEAETDTSADLNGNGENDLVGGLRLPLTPKFKGSAWLGYAAPTEWMGASEFFSRLQISHTGDRLNVLEPELPTESPNPQFENPAYTIADIRAGIRGDDWEVSVFLNNITDERAVYTIGTGLFEWGMASVADGREHVQRVYTNRPRELGIRFTKSWGL